MNLEDKIRILADHLYGQILTRFEQEAENSVLLIRPADFGPLEPWFAELRVNDLVSIAQTVMEKEFHLGISLTVYFDHGLGWFVVKPEVSIPERRSPGYDSY